MNTRYLWKPSTWLSAIATVGLIPIAVAQVAPAPTNPPPANPADTTKLEKFVVTGSMIKRIEGESSLPVQTITPLEMEQRGIASAEQMIMELNINGNGLDNLASNADVTAGAQRGNNGVTAANLRMQGAGATLVLLNGRRTAAAGLNSSVVDLNQIPFAAIERVEVLKDGASAIYGTDAIGGVLNFILKDNYQGAAAKASMDVTEHGGGNIFRYSAVAGYGDLNRDRYNIMTSVSLSDSKVLRGDQRDFVNTFQPNRGLSPDTRGTPVATLFAIGSAAVPVKTVLSGSGTGATTTAVGPVDPADKSANPIRVNGINYVDLPGGPGYAGLDGMGPYDEVLWQSAASKYGSAWDTGRAAVIQQPVKNTNVVVNGTFKVAENTKATFSGLWGRSVSNKSFSPNQWSSATPGNTTALDGKTVVPNPLGGMLYPSTGASYDKVFNTLVAYFPELAPNRGLPMAFRWRSVPLGNRAFTTTSDTWRAAAGLEGPLGFLSQWDYRIGASRAENKAKSKLDNGYVYTVPFVNLINTGVVDVFSYTQTPAAMAAIAKTSANGVVMYGGTYRTDEYDASATGPLFKLPAGTIQAAVGVDWRQESYLFTGDTRANLSSSDALIFNAPFDNGLATNGNLKRTIKAVFTELQIPIVKNLDFNAAGRIDQYTGFGSSKNPKFSLRWAPIEKFLVRSSYSTGFRVPTFKQMFDPVTESPFATTGAIDPKTGQQIPANSATTLFGGKSDLQPEKAKMYSAGFVVQPSKHLSASVDWWEINRTGTIQSFSATDLLTKYYPTFQDRLIRRADGTIAQIDTRWINAGETTTRGVDIDIKGDVDLGDKGGKLFANFNLSYLIQKKTRLAPNLDWQASEVDQFTRSSDIGLHDKSSASVGYRRGNWNFLVSEYYRNGYTDAVLPGVAAALKGAAGAPPLPKDWQPLVKPYNIWGLSVTYRGIKNTTIIAGVKNLFDKDPPFSATYDTNTGAGSSWEPRIADPRGRSYTMSVDYKFW